MLIIRGADPVRAARREQLAIPQAGQCGMVSRPAACDRQTNLSGFLATSPMRGGLTTNELRTTMNDGATGPNPHERNEKRS